MKRNRADEISQQNFTGESEESSWPRLEVQDLSDYTHGNEMDECTFRDMSVPQGPGNALAFIGGLTEESTCFTPNFQ